MVTTQEEWRELEQFPNYSISNYGEVVNIQRRTPVHPFADSNGYLRVVLYDGSGNRTLFYLHQLVATLYLEEHVIGCHVTHHDRNRNNNAASNLRIKTFERDSERFRSPTPVRGKRVRIKETGETFINAYACAKHIRGDPSNIYACLMGRRLSHRGYTFEYIEV